MKIKPIVVKAEWICAVCGQPARSAQENAPQKSTTGISACDILVSMMTITKRWAFGIRGQTEPGGDDPYQLHSTMAIPVVDLHEVLLSGADLGSCPQVEQLNSAFSTIGFVFIKNHGIPRKLVDL